MNFCLIKIVSKKNFLFHRQHSTRTELNCFNFGLLMFLFVAYFSWRFQYTCFFSLHFLKRFGSDMHAPLHKLNWISRFTVYGVFWCLNLITPIHFCLHDELVIEYFSLFFGSWLSQSNLKIALTVDGFNRLALVTYKHVS